MLYPSLPSHDNSPSVPASTWSTVAGRRNAQAGGGQNQTNQNVEGRQTPRNQQKGAWKKSLNILHGTADSSNTIAADVSLVAYGVAKDATADGLKSFLESKGITVVECINLTTFEHARTHCYKVTIKASEYENAARPEVWPYRVGVRLFKQFRKREDNQLSGWDAQVRNAGQVHPARAPVHAEVHGGAP